MPDDIAKAQLEYKVDIFNIPKYFDNKAINRYLRQKG